MLGAPLCPMTVASSRASRRPTEEEVGRSSCSTVCTVLSSRCWGLLCFFSSLMTSPKQLTRHDLRVQGGRKRRGGTPHYVAGSTRVHS